MAFTYDFKMVHLSGADQDREDLNAAGEDGYRLVQIVSS